MQAGDIRTYVLFAAFAMLAGCGGSNPQAEPPPAPTPAVQVDVFQVAPRDQAGVIRASGMVAYKRETSLSFSAAGEIESILVDAGDRVAAGQVLATLRRLSVGADSAESEVVRNNAQQTYDRVKRLFDAGAAAQADLDSARVALERTRSGMSVAAPASGVVLRRTVERGQVVAAAQTVLQIGETAAGVIARASVSSDEVRLIKEGDAAEIAVRGQAPRPGIVTRIAPEMADGMSSFLIEVRFSQPEGLRSGEIAEVLIKSSIAGGPATAAAVYIIPAISLIDARADQGVVFVVGADGKASRRAVQTEGMTDAGVVVIGGLAAGDAVITRGASMVRDGDPVQVKRD